MTLNLTVLLILNYVLITNVKNHILCKNNKVIKVPSEKEQHKC